jgi:Fe-S-cluster containining protein
MELSEATALADVFITQLLFRIHAIPTTVHTARAQDWLAASGSSAALGRAIVEAHRHAEKFAALGDVGADGWTRYLVLSALPMQVTTGRCPALTGGRCGIYERRPHACRTAPFHYSRPDSALAAALEQFVARPDYRCRSDSESPMALRNGVIVDPAFAASRKDAMDLQETEKPWRRAIAAALTGPHSGEFGLPGYRDVFMNSRLGRATGVPMKTAWMIGQAVGVFSSAQIQDILAKQIELLRVEGASETEAARREMLADYETAAA